MAILARGCDPVETRRGLPGNDGSDSHSRYLEAAVRAALPPLAARPIPAVVTL